ncbi:exonuclease SbcC [Aliivibrio fischeri]|uniref:AAA family ATPase n=1 Tax=Aliivibrio fischeri TaxID=668 RepID=UPI0012D8E66F|nr:AAA family ATPase [Aliivibrio fischeri]MUK30157.1 exonuclease SbcC [Aliivibrio fischeri]
MASHILINKLVVVGHEKNYSVNFNKGVNIIYGDSATGKSSILNLIDYLLGAKKFDLYPEIEASGKYAALDVELNAIRYTIKRDIFNSKNPIEVYPCRFENVDNYACKKYLPSFVDSHQFPGLDYFSNFLLDSLDLPKVKLKEAPTKDDSKLVRLSFRDIFKYCYVDQDALGSKGFLKSENYALQTKNKEVFKYIFNALDSNISNLEGVLSEKTSERKTIDKKYQMVAEFLRESEFESVHTLDNNVDKIDAQIKEIKLQINSLNKTSVSDYEIFNIIKEELKNIALKRREYLQQSQDKKLKVEKFTRLKNDYINDINKFKASISASNIIGKISIEKEICPICDNELNVSLAKERFTIDDKEKIAHEVNLLKRRVRDTESIIFKTKEDWEDINVQLKKLDEVESEALNVQEKNTKELTAPYLAERDIYTTKLGELIQKRKDFVNRLKVRNQHKHLSTSIKSLDVSILKLKDDIELLRKSAPSMSSVLSELADNLYAYLKFVKIKSPSDISYDSTSFAAKVRGIEYSNLTSGGLRTIVCIGYLCSLLEASLYAQLNYPSFLMIDTVGKYLGKTKNQSYKITKTQREADNLEAVSDPSKYKNIYEFIIELSEKFENQDRTCQIILVDNDVPDHIVKDLSGFIVAHYSSEKLNGLPVGFIDDVNIEV